MPCIKYRPNAIACFDESRLTREQKEERLYNFLKRNDYSVLLLAERLAKYLTTNEINTIISNTSNNI